MHALLAQRINNAAPALIDRGRPVSYRELAGESRRVAQGLRRLGVRAGDCVALWLPNLPAWLSVFFACAQLGAVAVAVNTRFRSHELADILHRSRARLLVFWPEFKGIDFAGILAACDPQALAHLATVVLYDESGAALPAAVLGKPAHAYAKLAVESPLPENGATHEAITGDGYYRSGDLGYTQADGRFVYLTRMGDSLRLGGFLVSPAEIEAVVQEVPGISACQVVAVPRAEGLIPVAFVLLESGATLDEAAVMAHASGALARYKLPRRVFSIEAFPVTPGANATKIQKGKLREMAEALLH